MVTRVVVAGSRGYTDYSAAEAYIDDCVRSIREQYDMVFVSGGCKGADQLGEMYAEKHGIHVEKYSAEWKKYGRRAGPIRNRKMAEIADLVICFWDGKSKGTESLIKYAKKLDKSDQIMQASREFSNWFDDLREQIKNSKTDTNQRDLENELSSINFCVERGWDPRDYIVKIAKFNTKKFIELYEKYQPVYKWRKNTNIFKLYVAVLNGEVKEIKKEIIFEDENFTAYIEGDRAYIKFLMKCKQQLIFAMKKRGWWWNTHKGAWSTYLDRVDKEWISNISKQYEQYL